MKTYRSVLLLVAIFAILSAQEFEETILRSPDPGKNDFFGTDMLFDEGYLIVSAAGDNTGGQDRGSVYVFMQTGADPTWLLHQKIQASDAVDRSWFGKGLGIDGNILVIGANADTPEDSQTGSAYVFERIDGSWEEVEKLFSLDGRPGDLFGSLEQLSLPGEDAFEIDSKSLATGVYFYNVAWNGRISASRKMLVIK